MGGKSQEKCRIWKVHCECYASTFAGATEASQRILAIHSGTLELSHTFYISMQSSLTMLTQF